MNNKPISVKKFVGCFVAISLMGAPVRADGPIKWAWENLLWGKSDPAEVVVNVIDQANRGGAEALAAALNRQSDITESQINQARIDAERKRRAAQQKVMNRLSEIAKAKDVIARRARQNGFGFDLEAETAMVRGKKIMTEDDFDETQRTCSRSILESFLAAASYDDNAQFVIKKQISRIKIMVLDNRNSARPDSIFGVGMELSLKGPTITKTVVPYLGIKGAHPSDVEPYRNYFQHKLEENRRYYPTKSIKDLAELTASEISISRDQIAYQTVVREVPSKEPRTLIINGFIGDKGCAAIDDEIHAQFAIWNDPSVKDNPLLANDAVGLGLLNLKTASLTSATRAPSISGGAPDVAGSGGPTRRADGTRQ